MNENLSTKILDILDEDLPAKNFLTGSIHVLSVSLVVIIRAHVKKQHWNKCMKDICDSLMFNMAKFHSTDEREDD